MSDDRDEKLDALLRARRIEPASQDLAARIILKAQSLPQAQDLSLWRSVRQLFAEFHLPQPGYVLATALVLGMMLGLSAAPDDGPSNDVSSATAQSYIAGDEELL